MVLESRAELTNFFPLSDSLFYLSVLLNFRVATCSSPWKGPCSYSTRAMSPTTFPYPTRHRGLSPSGACWREGILSEGCHSVDGPDLSMPRSRGVGRPPPLFLSSLWVSTILPWCLVAFAFLCWYGSHYYRWINTNSPRRGRASFLSFDLSLTRVIKSLRSHFAKRTRPLSAFSIVSSAIPPRQQLQ
ncbi:MAG: hypothetical protein J3Q66DRAFT_349777 [Benniella sp.]|nr:MAG: hypothetical protein J3Q66DRAFT_349777 [Benniella sp.]